MTLRSLNLLPSTSTVRTFKASGNIAVISKPFSLLGLPTKDNAEMSNQLSLRMVSALHLPVNTVSSKLSGRPRPNPAVIRHESSSRIFFLVLIEVQVLGPVKQLITTSKSSTIQSTHSTLSATIAPCHLEHLLLVSQ